MSLITWSWIFLVVYISGMLLIGLIGQRKVKHADDFATARGSYGPLFLAFAFAATTASGATFLGSPGFGYEWGLGTQWGNLLYPTGVYFGVLISMRLIATSGNRFGNRSIPEYLGDRYQSNGIRVMVSLFSLVLFFYLAGQLVSGLVMFETMLGLEPMWALIITTAVLLFYVVLGGAHADILTDGVQGFMMLMLAVLVIIMFVMGFGVDGGFSSMWENLRSQDPNLVTPLNPKTPLAHSWWSIIAIFFAHIPLGLLPHLGNKLWALKDVDQQKSFVKLACLFGVTLGMMGLGGMLARSVIGDVLLHGDATPNESLPRLFIELFPTWLAALIGVGVLSAIMSTADGLVIAASQIIANDLYRRTFAPRFAKHLNEEQLDHRVLNISRVSTIVVLLLCMGLAWLIQKVNISLIVWIGNGGMMAAFAGPLVMGALWKGVTRIGAYCGLAAGFVTFLALHTSFFDFSAFESVNFGPILSSESMSDGLFKTVVAWLEGEAPNPFSCAAMGEFVSILITFVVSKLTRKLPQDHLDEMFEADASTSS